jgi:hypothetical protein
MTEHRRTTCPPWCQTELFYRGTDVDGRQIEPEDASARHYSEVVTAVLADGSAIALQLEHFVPEPPKYAHEARTTLSMSGDRVGETAVIDIELTASDLRSVAAALIQLAEAVGS